MPSEPRTPDQQTPQPPTTQQNPGTAATAFVFKLVALTLLLGLAEAYIMQLSRQGREPDFVFHLREAVATLGATLAHVFDSRVQHDSVIITGKSLQLIVSVECTALFAKSLFCAAAIAYPTAWKYRAVGCVIGLLGVFMLNVFRIAGLALISIWFPGFFHFAHLVLMQWFLISCVAPLWLLWAMWATKRPQRQRA
jgi:exosortase/archaeosortase family protein